MENVEQDCSYMAVSTGFKGCDRADSESAGGASVVAGGTAVATAAALVVRGGSG